MHHVTSLYLWKLLPTHCSVTETEASLRSQTWTQLSRYSAVNAPSSTEPRTCSSRSSKSVLRWQSTSVSPIPSAAARFTAQLAHLASFSHQSSPRTRQQPALLNRHSQLAEPPIAPKSSLADTATLIVPGKATILNPKDTHPNTLQVVDVCRVYSEGRPELDQCLVFDFRLFSLCVLR